MDEFSHVTAIPFKYLVAPVVFKLYQARLFIFNEVLSVQIQVTNAGASGRELMVIFC